jgi:hypothetical protein
LTQVIAQRIFRGRAGKIQRATAGNLVLVSAPR